MIGGPKATLVRLDLDEESTSIEPGSTETELACGAISGIPADVIHTRGSTGKSTLGLMADWNAVRLSAAVDFRFEGDAKDLRTLFHSDAFDCSVMGDVALLHGGSAGCGANVSRSPEEFAALIEKEPVTAGNRTPSGVKQSSETNVAKVSTTRTERTHR